MSPAAHLQQPPSEDINAHSKQAEMEVSGICQIKDSSWISHPSPQHKTGHFKANEQHLEST